MESEGEQVQQLISPEKTTPSSIDDRRINPRSSSIPTDSFHTMSYPENQQPASSAAQTNGNRSANPTTQVPAPPSSPAMERFLGERVWEEPFNGLGSRAVASNNANNDNNGTSTQAEKSS
ncbi:hypothetical protein P171DRAFT_487729 [Karstenula rhodostoma CBS 690.94]|uniref:Uncharacterized protein n=1 Tax=Karstenula rhodostoma CBS 690.94 TaxID=1392251 RepID=A0A9P4PEN8_9PLEO|nr:hypothetical protein P171DRAFT_487729 [Karstenula rhodostoma CBS 690.94]